MNGTALENKLSGGVLTSVNSFHTSLHCYILCRLQLLPLQANRKVSPYTETDSSQKEVSFHRGRHHENDVLMNKTENEQREHYVFSSLSWIGDQTNFTTWDLTLSTYNVSNIESGFKVVSYIL